MDHYITAIVEAAKAMSWVEILANVTFATSVILCNFRRWENYPLGIIGTIAFFFVFWQAKLYNVALLQVWLTGVQLYGWWYWLKGDHGTVPQITTFKGAFWKWTGGSVAFTVIVGLLLAAISSHFGGVMAIPDAMLFSLSVVAQFLMDRKKLENWTVWLLINTISIPLFWSQGLYLTALIYAAFWVNAFFGHFMWLKEYKSYSAAKLPENFLSGMGTTV